MELIPYPIVLKGDPILNQIAKPIIVFNKGFQEVVVRMRLTLKKEKGLGLAAPQVGLPIRLMLIKRGDEILNLCNPVVIASGGEQLFTEGCLSIPGKSVTKKRPEWVQVEYQKHNSQKMRVNFAGRDAVVFFHELDHLNGILMDDEENAYQNIN